VIDSSVAFGPSAGSNPAPGCAIAVLPAQSSTMEIRFLISTFLDSIAFVAT
jgi:hypothetical protein